MYLGKSLGKLGDSENISESLLSVCDNLHIRGKEIGERASFKIKDTAEAELVTHRLGDVGQIRSVCVIIICSLVRIQEAYKAF